MSNPAERLHSILQDCRKPELRPLPMLKAWRVVLGIGDSPDDVLVMSQVGKVFTIPYIISRRFERISDIDTELFLGWRIDLNKAFQAIRFGQGHQFIGFADKLTASLLLGIRHCSHELNRRFTEVTLSDTDLQELRESANALLDQALAANLPGDIGQHLLEQIYKLIEAIDDYQITGAAGVDRAVKEALGTVIVNNRVAREAASTPQGRDYWKIIERLSVLLKIGNDMRKFLDPFVSPPSISN